MKQRHHNIPAYVLHTRKYRDTSLLVDFFTAELGRCSAVVKGVYSGKNPKRNLLQPFVPLSISLQGSSELLSLSTVEMQGAPQYYVGEALACGLYLNELLTYTVHRYDPHPQLFIAYEEALAQLQSSSVAIALRNFELTLLEELGYGIHFIKEDNNATAFEFVAGRGFINAAPNAEWTINENVICDILDRKWQCPEALKSAKRITRLALAPLLAGKTIHSRELLKAAATQGDTNS